MTIHSLLGRAESLSIGNPGETASGNPERKASDQENPVSIWHLDEHWFIMRPCLGATGRGRGAGLSGYSGAFEPAAGVSYQNAKHRR
ncbi:hypothetical protein [Bordetella bronchiseptica]|uniref:hypothetical protein n=1 Tax=Bordetella bronchiseptica TaxID=518 RepID=UPI0011D28131|nr:hypothetical protein [Bordetella bronchiseptica]